MISRSKCTKLYKILFNLKFVAFEIHFGVIFSNNSMLVSTNQTYRAFGRTKILVKSFNNPPISTVNISFHAVARSFKTSNILIVPNATATVAQQQPSFRYLRGTSPGSWNSAKDQKRKEVCATSLVCFCNLFTLIEVMAHFSWGGTRNPKTAKPASSSRANCVPRRHEQETEAKYLIRNLRRISASAATVFLDTAPVPGSSPARKVNRKKQTSRRRMLLFWRAPWPAEAGNTGKWNSFFVYKSGKISPGRRRPTPQM